jgi:hypothetical protein
MKLAKRAPAPVPVPTAPGGLSTVPLAVESPFVYPAVYPGAVFAPSKLQKCLRHRHNCKKRPTYPRKRTSVESAWHVRFRRQR